MLIAAIGASAHSGFSLARLAGVQSSVSGDEASGTRTEPTEKPEVTKTPEPTDTPEAPPTAEPTEKPDTETDSDTETKDNHGQVVAATKSQDSHGDSQSGGSDKKKGD